jgi:hypothetical protein
MLIENNMETKILNLDLSRLRLEEHFGFISLVATAMSACNSPLFTPLHAEFANSVTALDVVLERARGSHITRSLAEADRRRDDAYRGLAGRVQSGLHHFIADKAEAARRVDAILSLYGNPVSLPYLQENGVLLNLVQDLDTPETRALLARLDAEEWLDELKASNAGFIALFTARNEERAASLSGSAREARLAATLAYQACVTRLNALVEVEGPDAYATVISAVNRLIEYQKNVLNIRDGRKGKAGQQEAGTNEEE